MKKPRFIMTFLAISAVVIAGALIIFGFDGQPQDVEYAVQKSSYSGPLAEIGSLEIPVEVAMTDAERQRGLSGRASLSEDSGMLFVFEAPAIHNFWMPDMHFPIDIIWINEGEVVDISENVSDDFDPERPLFYFPSAPAQYVLEVNAGFASKHGIKIGDEAAFRGI